MSSVVFRTLAVKPIPPDATKVGQEGEISNMAKQRSFQIHGRIGGNGSIAPRSSHPSKRAVVDQSVTIGRFHQLATIAES